MNDSSRPIRIAGAGISGMTAAILLCNAGHSVELFEKRNRIGGRFKGDWQGIENWTSSHDALAEIESLTLGIDLKTHPLPPLYLLAGTRQVHPIKCVQPLCYLVKRGPESDTLDQQFYRRIQSLGIPIHFNHALEENQADIVATGPVSKQIFATDVGIRFRTQHEDIAVAMVDDQAAYKGYAYLLIVNGEGCLCSVAFKEFTDIHKQLEFAREVLFTHFPMDIYDVEKVGGVGSFSTHYHHQIAPLRIGEAAGIQDFLFGFGIRSAIQSASLAVQCLLEDRSFQSAFKAQFLDRHKAGVVNRFLFERIGSLYWGYPIVSKWVSKHKSPNKFLRRAYRYTKVHHYLYNRAADALKNRYEGIV